MSEREGYLGKSMRHFMTTMIIALFGAPVLGMADTATEAPRPELSLERIALELSNPVTALRRLDWDIEYSNFRGGLPNADDQSSLKNVFTPSWPFKLKNGKNLIVSATIPISSDQPTWEVNWWLHYAEFRLRQVEELFLDQSEFISGHDYLDDVSIDIAYGGENENGFISMFGLSNVLPISEDRSASRQQWLIGPDIALGQVTSWGLYGARAKHLTSISEPQVHIYGGEPWDTNETTLQLFFAYALGNGWQIESSPVILYDWEALPGNEWLVPIGAGVSKTMKLGRTPIKLGFDIQKYVVTPDRFGPDWRVTVSLTPVLSSKLLR